MSHAVRHPSWFDPLLTAAAPVMWGSTYLVAAEWLPPDHPLTTAAIRTLPAGLLLVLATRAFALPIAPVRLIVLALVNIGLFQGLLFVAAHRLPGGIAAVIGALQPLLLLALAWQVDRDRPTAFALGAAGLGILGMALIFAAPEATYDAAGLAAAFGATASMAVGSFLSRRWRGTSPLLPFAGWQILIGGVALLPFAVVMEAPLPALSPVQGTAYLYLVVAGTVVAYPLWLRGLSRLPPGAVASLNLLNPLTAVVLGWLVTGPTPTPREFAGMGVVLLSVAVLQGATTAPNRLPTHFAAVTGRTDAVPPSLSKP